jgi:hypothetical protein
MRWVVAWSFAGDDDGQKGQIGQKGHVPKDGVFQKRCRQEDESRRFEVDVASLAVTALPDEQLDAPDSHATAVRAIRSRVATSLKSKGTMSDSLAADVQDKVIYRASYSTYSSIAGTTH